MFDDSSFNEGVNVGKRIAAGSIIASLAVLAILGVTVALNTKKPKGNNNNNNPIYFAGQICVPVIKEKD